MAERRQSPNAKPRNSLTAKRLRKILHYDPDTGEWRWLKPPFKAPVRPGDRAGTRSRGYLFIGIGYTKYKSARLAWLFMTGKWPTLWVDHIDGNPSNDRWSNLREANASQNTVNKKHHSNNTSGFKGVSWSRYHAKWWAQICKDYHHIHLGFFDTPEAAYEAYKAKARELFGEYARLQ